MESHLALALLIAYKKIVIPAKTGTHFSTNSQADEWVPAFAGMTLQLCPLLGIAGAAFRQQEDVNLGSNHRLQGTG
jgi:hypothetical protein